MRMRMWRRGFSSVILRSHRQVLPRVFTVMMIGRRLKLWGILSGEEFVILAALAFRQLHVHILPDDWHDS